MVAARISLFRGARTFRASGSGFHRDLIAKGVLIRDACRSAYGGLPARFSGIFFQKLARHVTSATLADRAFAGFRGSTAGGIGTKKERSVFGG
jgi:hypothetical protein